jgi:hypothetical protein
MHSVSEIEPGVCLRDSGNARRIFQEVHKSINSQPLGEVLHVLSLHLAKAAFGAVSREDLVRHMGWYYDEQAKTSTQ